MDSTDRPRETKRGKPEEQTTTKEEQRSNWNDSTREKLLRSKEEKSENKD